MGRCLRARQFPAQILSHMELERSCERRLDRGAVHFAIALGGMAIARRKKPALIKHWQVNGASGRELLAIDISAEFARLLAVLPTEPLRRGHGELPEERAHRYGQARWQDRYIALAVKLEMDEAIVLEFVGQRFALG